MKYLFIIAFLLLLTACAQQPLSEVHVLEQYGTPDHVTHVDMVKRDLSTGIIHSRSLVYNLPLGGNRVFFLMDNRVSGIVRYNPDGSAEIEYFPNEPALLHYKRMFNDFLVV